MTDLPDPAADARLPTAPLPVALVGCGIIGTVHARAIAADPALRLVALIDSDIQQARRLAQTLATSPAVTTSPALPTDQTLDAELPVFASLAEAAAAEAAGELSFEAVGIATPSGSHTAEATAALHLGKHVLVEKPLDTHPRKIRAFLEDAERARQRGLTVAVVSQLRLEDAILRIKDAFTEVGSPLPSGPFVSGVALSPVWRDQAYYDSADWRGTWALDGGGAVMNQGIHLVDLLLYFLGKPQEIYARTGLFAHHGIEVEDSAVATLVFESGALAVVHASTSAAPGLPTQLQLLGPRGSAVVLGSSAGTELQFLHRVGGSADTVSQSDVTPGTTGVATLGPSGHGRQYRDFARAVRTGTAPSTPVEEGARAALTIYAMYCSAALGRPVLLADVEAGLYDETDLTAHSTPDIPPTTLVFRDHEQLGQRAAEQAARALRTALATRGSARLMLAAAPSQGPVLAALARQPGIDWSAIDCFHMDDYLGLDAAAPQGFGNWLEHHFFQSLPPGAGARFHRIPTEGDPLVAARHYAEQMGTDPFDVVLLGIGVNGHLAFNDPPALFTDAQAARVVTLDGRSVAQQVAEGHFPEASAVPQEAITVTIPRLLNAETLICSVLGTEKSQAVADTFAQGIGGAHPSTALRTHPRVTLYLDEGAAALLPDSVRPDASRAS
ncbi:6-phosphogluconolactonase [Psychromicrobium xiongbiense]|uniref:Gfo/Idh/MocA family protein n=1 Tax=Psychromicrobium xiongbiense TaxID=3051184 RepID=UPI002554DAD4|nr:6-phosphogluconolactonase [Psychromicrobium sp. YIM S02556]